MTSSVRSLGGQRFKAAFTPYQALPHRVDIKFNGETVPGKYLHGFLLPNNDIDVMFCQNVVSFTLFGAKLIIKRLMKWNKDVL